MKPQNRTTLGCASRANASRRLHATVHGHDASVFQKRLLKENYNGKSDTWLPFVCKGSLRLGFAP